MKTILAILVLGSALLMGDAVSPPQARCAFCYTGPCYNSMICGQGCTCLKRGMDLQGYCYGN